MTTMAPAVQTEPTKQHWIPRDNSSDQEKKDFVKKIIDDSNQYRRWQMLRMARNGWFYRGRQWILEPRELRANSSGQYYFGEIRRRTEHGDDVPMPVSNMIGPAVDNEVARLGRREYEAQVDTGNGSPEEMNAARVAKGYLEWSHKVKKWPAKREAVGYDLSRLATATLKTYWDESTDDLYRIGVTGAVKCRSCPTVLASPEVGITDAREFRNTEYADLEGGKLKLNVCPTCDMPMDEPEPTDNPTEEASEYQALPGQPRPDLIALEPYDVGQEEAESGVDMMGRPLGQDVPRGEVCYEVVSQFELFPEGGGMGVECDSVKIMGQRSVKGVDWIEARVPDWAGQVRAEPAADLQKAHPTFGERGFSGGSAAESTYPNHAFFLEVHIEPMGLEGLELGLSIIQCGDLVKSRPLCVEVPRPNGQTAKVRRVQYQSAVCKRIEGEFWGRTEVDDLIPLNRRLNRLDAQVEMIREGGIPTVWLPSEIELYPREDMDGAFKMLEYDGPQGWSPEKAMVNGQPLTGNGYMPEREAILADMQKVGFPPDVSLGITGGLNDLNTSALMLVSEEAAVKRGPRERGLIAMFEKAWTHDLEMTWAFRKEDAEFTVLDEAGQAARKSFTGADILGQCQVTIEKSAGYDETIYRKEGVKEAIAAQALVLDTPVKRYRFIKDSNLSTKLIENDAMQIERAEGAWSGFIGKGKIPPFDPSIQDHAVRFDTFGRRWEDDECVEKRDGCQFDETVLPVIYGWEQKLSAVDAKEAMSRPIYGSRPPEEWMAIQAEGTRLLAAKVKAETPLPQPGIPPPPPAPVQTFPQPPAQGFLPEALDRRIYAFWRRLLGSVVQDPAPAPAQAGLPSAAPTSELVSLLKMRAVLEAHKMLAEKAKAMAMGGAPAVAAPGGDQPGMAPPAPQPAPVAA